MQTKAHIHIFSAKVAILNQMKARGGPVGRQEL